MRHDPKRSDPASVAVAVVVVVVVVVAAAVDETVGSSGS